jgi:hypothetical protein
MNTSEAPTPVRAAANYAMGIRSRRDLLQTLYYATKNSADEAWALHTQLQPLEPRLGINAAALGTAPINGAPPIRPGDVLPRHEILNSKRAAEATAQDAACALMLILDFSLRRLEEGIGSLDTRELGPEIAPRIRLNKAIWALASQARHAHEWMATPDSKLDANPRAQVIKALKHDPRNLNAAREIVCGLQLNAYVTLEGMMLRTARDIIEPTGWKLGMVSAGTFRLDPPS